MAETILNISQNQNCEKLQALSLLAIGEITKSMSHLRQALKIYEESSEQIFTNDQYGQLCMNLAREYRKSKED
jgi:TPR repeat protein